MPLATRFLIALGRIQVIENCSKEICQGGRCAAYQQPGFICQCKTDGRPIQVLGGYSL